MFSNNVHGTIVIPSISTFADPVSIANIRTIVILSVTTFANPINITNNSIIVTSATVFQGSSYP